MKVVLYNAQQAHAAIMNLWAQIKGPMVDGQQYVIELREKTRSNEQNARMWAMLSDVSRQVIWHGRKLSPEEWKHVFSASLKRQDVVPGIDGGFVVLGLSTSKMSVREMGDLMELISAFGAQNGVKFSAPEYMEE
jgi:NinB protein